MRLNEAQRRFFFSGWVPGYVSNSLHGPAAIRESIEKSDPFSPGYFTWRQTAEQLGDRFQSIDTS